MTRGVLAWVCGLALLLSTAAAAQGADDVSVDVAVRSTGEVGEVMSATVTIQGPVGADASLLTLPEPDGARLDLASGPSHKVSQLIANGKVQRTMTTQWTFRFVPERPGAVVLPPIAFEARGREVASDPVTVQIKESSVPRDAVRLDLVPDATDLWVGQVFDVVVVAAVRTDQWANLLSRNGLDLELPWLRDDALDVLGAAELRPAPSDVVLNRAERIGMDNGRELRDGVEFHTLTRRIQMQATRPGRVDLSESRFGARIATSTRTQRDPFSFFNNRKVVVADRSVSIDAWYDGPSLVIREPPLDGRPGSFTDAIGAFSFSATATPTTLRVGETCRLVLEVRGQGNLDTFTWPEHPELERDFRLFDRSEETEPGFRRVTWEMSPINDRVEEVPALAFTAFDPMAHVYLERTSAPIPLDVSPGGDGGLVDLSRPEDILRDLQTIHDVLPPPAPAPLPAWVWWSSALALVVLADARTRVSEWRTRNPTRVARAGARKRFDKALATAEGPADVARAFSHFLSDRLDGPPAGLSGGEARERLADAAVGERVERTVAGWEAAYLGGATLVLGDVVEEARELADAVEAAS